jgi:hypothetical protein
MIYATNITWPHISKAVKALQPLSAGYKLNYSRAMELNDPSPWLSGLYPSFGSNYPLNSFQIIWDRANPTHIWINHGYPDVYNEARQALINAGFTIVTTKPNL